MLRMTKPYTQDLGGTAENTHMRARQLSASTLAWSDAHALSASALARSCRGADLCVEVGLSRCFDRRCITVHIRTAIAAHTFGASTGYIGPDSTRFDVDPMHATRSIAA